MRIAASLDGMAPVLTASATNRGGHGVPGLTMTGERVKSGGWRRHQVHKANAWVECQFRVPSRCGRTKVKTVECCLKTLLLCFRLSPYFWFPDLTLLWF